MAKYKPVDAGQLDADLTAVANAIREKTESTEPMVFPDGFVSAVNAIKVSNLTENARVYYIGTAENVLNMDTMDFISNAVGELTQ